MFIKNRQSVWYIIVIWTHFGVLTVTASGTCNTASYLLLPLLIHPLLPLCNMQHCFIKIFLYIYTVIHPWKMEQNRISCWWKFLITNIFLQSRLYFGLLMSKIWQSESYKLHSKLWLCLHKALGCSGQALNQGCQDRRSSHPSYHLKFLGLLLSTPS